MLVRQLALWQGCVNYFNATFIFAALKPRKQS